ncbi:hypothetical protein CLOM_g21491 [Closterium sp. NIES-68]|nr:hypothetical protein CLOM_g21491 [Closterium sp. NIES-68]
MGLSDTDKCTAGGSPTEAFEKLITLDGSSGLTGDNDPASSFPVYAFESTRFKGYVGLMLAVQRQPVDIDCNQPLPKEIVLQLDGTPPTPCTAFFYTLNMRHSNPPISIETPVHLSASS